MKILIISSNLIGDSILSTCVIEYFAKINPDSKFTFVTGPAASQIYEHFPLTFNIISIQKKKFNLHWLEMYSKVFRNKWDIVIDLRSSLISYFLFSKKKYIFKKNKTLKHLDQLKKFFNFKDSSLFVHTSKKETNLANNNLSKKFKYVVIFPGGNWKPKIWPAKFYNELIRKLISKYSNIKFILVGSLDEKKIYLKDVTNNINENLIIDLMGKSLTETSAYMKKSNLFIGNDSGLMHLSVASNLATIALFGPTNDKIYGHQNFNSFIIRTKEKIEYFNKQNIDINKSYMMSINSETILDLINKKNLL